MADELTSMYDDEPDFSELPEDAETSEPEKPLEAPQEESEEDEGEETKEEPEAAAEAPGAPGEEGEGKEEEGGEDALRKEEEEAAEGEVKLPEEVEIDGEKVPSGDLLSAWKESRELRGEVEKLKKVEEDFGSLRDDLVKAPARALLSIYTAQAGGDRQKGYTYLRDIAFKIAEYDYTLAQMSEGERRAVFLEAEKTELEQKLKAQEQVVQSQEQKKRQEQVRGVIGADLKAGEIEDNMLNVGRIAAILNQARADEKELSVTGAVEILKKNLQKEWEERLSKLDPKDLPEEFRRKLAQGRVQKANSPQQPEAKTTPPKGSKPKAKKGRPRNVLVGMSDFGAFLDGEVEGKPI
jgi:hypothetical protein